MADTNKDINLRIRATDYSKKTFQDLTKAIDSIVDAQTRQQEAAEKGETSAKALEKSYGDLERATRAVVKQAADVSAFKAQQSTLQAAQEATAKAREGYDQLSRKLEQLKRPTAEQNAELRELRREMERSEKAERTQIDKLATIEGRLKSYGVATKDLDGAMGRMVSQVDKANASLQRQDQAVEVNAKAMRELADAEKLAAQQRLEAKLQQQQAALRSTANEAISMARGWRTAAVAVSDTARAFEPVTRSIESVINPAKSAARTLDSMGKSAENMANEFGDIKKPVQDLTDKMRELDAVQKGIAQSGQLVDSYRRQMIAVRDARTEYVNARDAVKMYAAQLTNMDADTAKVETQLNRANRALRDSALNYRESADAAKLTRSALNEAGISTQNLSAAEARLVKTATDSKMAQDSLRTAVEKYGESADKGTAASRFFNAQQERGASVIASARHHILALTAAYTGLHGAMHLAGGVIEDTKNRQATLSAASVMTGHSAKAQAEEWAYLTKMADKYGLRLGELGQEYGRFAASASMAGRSQQEVRFMFEQVATLGQAYHLSADEMSRAMLAIEQMVGRNQIMTQEFKLQFAGVIPGAFEEGAAKLNMTVPEFTKAIEKGQLDISALVQILRGMGKDAAGAAQQASDGLVSAEARLANARTAFNLTIADSGFIKEYTNLLTRVTQLLRSDEGTALAKQLGGAFNAAADAAVFLASHLEAVTTAVKLLAFYMGAKVFLSFGSTIFASIGTLIKFNSFLDATKLALIGMSYQMAGATVATGVLSAALRLLGKSIPIIGWIVAIGSFIYAVYESSETFQNIVHTMVEYAAAAFRYLKNALTGNYQSFSDTLKQMRKEAADADEEIKRREQADKMKAWKDATGMPDGIGPDGQASDPGTVYDRKKVALDKFNQYAEREDKRLESEEKQAQQAKYKDNLAMRLKMVHDEFAERRKAAIADGLEFANGGEAMVKLADMEDRAEAAERQKFANEHVKRGVNTAKRRADAIMEVERKLASDRDDLESRGDKQNRTNEYAEREQNAVNKTLDKYRQVEDQIKALGGTEGKRFSATLRGLKQEDAALARRIEQHRQIDNLTKERDNLSAMRDAQIDAYKAKFEAGQMTEAEYVEKVNQSYRDTKPAIDDATQAIREFAVNHREAFPSDSDFQKLMSNLDAYQTRLDQQGNKMAKFQEDFVQGLSGVTKPAFDSIVDSTVKVRDGIGSWGDMFTNLTTTMAQFFSQLLQQMAMAILQATILKSLMSFFGPASSASSGGSPFELSNFAVHHTGGVIGMGGSGQGSRSAPISSFVNAQRYHTGGMIGFKPDEVPIIAQRGEEMLTRDDPRNRMNGGGGQGQQPNFNIIAVDDQRAAVTESLKTPEGSQALIMSIRQNLSSIKPMLK